MNAIAATGGTIRFSFSVTLNFEFFSDGSAISGGTATFNIPQNSIDLNPVAPSVATPEPAGPVGWAAG